MDCFISSKSTLLELLKYLTSSGSNANWSCCVFAFDTNDIICNCHVEIHDIKVSDTLTDLS